jgi:hypothetical protein
LPLELRLQLGMESSCQISQSSWIIEQILILVKR